MRNHVFLSASNIDRSIGFYGAALAPLDIINRPDYDGKDDPSGHSDQKGFGENGRMLFWLRHGSVAPDALHIGFAADSEGTLNFAYAEALKAGATFIHSPGPQLHYDSRYCAAQVRNLGGYGIEFSYKNW